MNQVSYPYKTESLYLKVKKKVTYTHLTHYFDVFLIRTVGGGESKLGPLGTSSTNWPTVPVPGDYDDGEFWWNDDSQGKPKYSENTCPTASLFTTNPTWPEPARVRAAAVGSRRLTDWAMARPFDGG
jgi:hypothetical protein